MAIFNPIQMGLSPGQIDSLISILIPGDELVVQSVEEAESIRLRIKQLNPRCGVLVKVV